MRCEPGGEGDYGVGKRDGKRKILPPGESPEGDMGSMKQMENEKYSLRGKVRREFTFRFP